MFFVVCFSGSDLVVIECLGMVQSADDVFAVAYQEISVLRGIIFSVHGVRSLIRIFSQYMYRYINIRLEGHCLVEQAAVLNLP